MTDAPARPSRSAGGGRPAPLPEHRLRPSGTAAAALEQFITVLNAGDSATAQLSRWWGSPVQAEIRHRAERCASRWEAELLRTASHAVVQDRRVLLRDHRGIALSDAEAIVAMERLPLPLQHRLRTGPDPLGVVIGPLRFRRTILSMSACPDAAHVLEVTATLTVAGLPIAYVRERYRRSTLHPP